MRQLTQKPLAWRWETHQSSGMGDLNENGFVNWVMASRNNIYWLGSVAYACNPRTLEGWGRWITRSGIQDQAGQRGETPPHLYFKNKKISWAWWLVPVIPAIHEAEAGESLEPRGQSLKWAEIIARALQPGLQSEILSKKKPIHRIRSWSSHKILLFYIYYLFTFVAYVINYVIIMISQSKV